MEKPTEMRGLGRGLSALLADVKSDTAPSEARLRSAETFVSVDKIHPNPNQPRRDFRSDSLNELAESIRQKGVIQPLIVRAMPDSDGFEIVAGERRWRAAQLAQVHELPVIVRVLSDSEVIEIAIIENIQRADLNAIEEALAYKQLMERFGHTQEKLATALSRSRSHIANTLRLLVLPDSVQYLVRDGGLTAGHARALIPSAHAAELAKDVVRRGLSVRETERLVKAPFKPAGSTGSRRPEPAKDADTRSLEADLSAHLGMSVTIEHPATGDSGTLQIRYKNLDQLDYLCRALSVIPRDFPA